MATVLFTFCILWATADDSLHSPRPSHLLLDRHQRYLGEVPGEQGAFGYWPLPAVLPEKLAVATLETEDRNYFEHGGVYGPSVLRAVWQNVSNGEVISGASTIAMQVARLQHPKARTLFAKAREAVEAEALIRRHGHDQVLRQYLTLAPYGNLAHGAERASRLYFDKPASDLSWLQAAFLAALPQQPGRMSPWTQDGRARATRRAKTILRQLHDRGVIDDEALRVALASDLMLVPRPHRSDDALHAVLMLARRLPTEGVVHTTTLDLDVQHQAARAVAENLERIEWTGAGNSAALVADVPSGEVLAWVGSADYGDDAHHGAIDYLEAKRSPGSTLKPFIYGMALERGTHTAATELADVRVSFDTGDSLYVPENITHNFLGPMLLRQALANSRNIPALRVLSDVGVDRVVERLARGGVKGVRYEPDAYGLSLALGAMPVTAAELATLYSGLANQGVTTPLRFFLDQPAEPGARILSRESAMLITHMLADPDARRPGFPPGGPLDFDVPVAVKTGTSQGARDAWTAGFSDRLLVVTWVGNHDWRRMHSASGGTAAAPPFHRIMETVMPQRELARPWANAFALPPELVAREVCALSGRRPGPGCAHVKTEYFLPGTEPVESCPFHATVAVDVRNGLRATPSCPKKFVEQRAMLDLPAEYAPWAQQEHVAVAPTQDSPLCPREEAPRSIAIREPAPKSRYLFDPDTPKELSGVRLAAQVSPPTEEIVWLVDGEPVARVGYPYEVRYPLPPGRHVIRAAMARSSEKSLAVTVVVDD